MSITTQMTLVFALAAGLLLATAGTAHAQSADQSFKSIPQQVKTNAETRATTKSNDVANSAMTKLDSASNRTFRKITGLFKRKDHPGNTPPNPDSSGTHPADTTISNHKNFPS